MRWREAAIFAAATAISIDLLLTGFSYWSPTPEVRSQFAALFEGWDVVKGTVAALALLAVGLRARSTLLTIFAVVLGLVAALEETSGTALADRILQQFGFSTTTTVAGAPAFLYGDLAVLGGLALLSTIAVWLAPAKGPQLKRVRSDLLLLLAGLFVFAVGIGFYADLVTSSSWKIVEEGGEQLFMSLILGYVIGLLVSPPRTV